MGNFYPIPAPLNALAQPDPPQRCQIASWSRFQWKKGREEVRKPDHFGGKVPKTALFPENPSPQFPAQGSHPRLSSTCCHAMVNKLHIEEGRREKNGKTSWEERSQSKKGFKQAWKVMGSIGMQRSFIHYSQLCPENMPQPEKIGNIHRANPGLGWDVAFNASLHPEIAAFYPFLPLFKANCYFCPAPGNEFGS